VKPSPYYLIDSPEPLREYEPSQFHEDSSSYFILVLAISHFGAESCQRDSKQPLSQHATGVRC
jgi:hypothetical protein